MQSTTNQAPGGPSVFNSLSVAIAGLIAAVLLSACGGGGASPGAESGDLSAAASLGQKIFNDPSLSASGAMSCASCHAANLGHASPFSTAVAFGGAALDQAGTRTPPAINYLRYGPSFGFAPDGTPTGGFTWDGRASSLADQAKAPFLAANEMANADVNAVVARLAATSYAPAFKAAFGADIFKTPQQAFERATYALERYQMEDPDFAPFDSKFDQFTAGHVALSDQELRGLALFNRPDKGNCAACHPSSKPANAPGALFTDFTFDSLGVSRNPEIPANADPTYFDLGLCGPVRTDLQSRRDLCGQFKVPSLRNVALRKRFFHNGRFNSLEDVVRFYVQRDTNPRDWYPSDASGQVQKFNDLPVDLRANVNVLEVPYNRRAGDAPALNDAEVQDLVVFLRTLTDGYKP
jgi:cytochrome c peroxidase